LLIDWGWTSGERCSVKREEGNKLIFKNCKTEDLKTNQVSMNSDYVNEINANLGDNKFTILDDGVFKKYKNLATLKLKFCEISGISHGAFQGLAKLKSLDLSNNNLGNSLDENVFQSLANLEKLDLGDNNIECLDNNLLQNIPNLKWLSLSSNKITTLDPIFFTHFKKITELWINHNQITTLNSDTFTENRKLKVIYLDDNEISEIESDTFTNLIDLKHLDLDRNDCIAEVFTNLGSKLNMDKVNTNLKTCYKNFDNLLKEIKKSIISRTATTSCQLAVMCPTCTSDHCTIYQNDAGKFHTITIGLISLLLLISVIANVILCVKKSNNRTNINVKEETLNMSQPDQSYYTPMNSRGLKPATSNEPDYEFGYCDDGTVNIYNKVPKIFNKTNYNAYQKKPPPKIPT
jgi:hypothetical protein